MTYSTTQAQSGRGTSFSIGSTPVLIGEIRSINQSGNQWEIADVTNMQSGITKEKILTILDTGEFDLTCNRVGSDAGQVALQSAFAGANAGVLQVCVIQLLKSGTQTTTGDSIHFNGYVQSQNLTIEPTKEITSSWKVLVSGPYTTTAGS